LPWVVGDSISCAHQRLTGHSAVDSKTW